MLVEDVMTSDIVTCGVDEPLRTAVGRMLDDHVGSVVVTDGGTPTGIVTETDALQAGYVTEQCFGDIPVAEVMTSPLVTTEPTRTIRSAVERMADENVKKLPVLDDLDLAGIITMTDVTRHYGDIVREIHEIERPRGRRDRQWRGDDG